MFPTQLYNFVINRILLFFPSNIMPTFLMNQKVGKVLYKSFFIQCFILHYFFQKSAFLLTLCDSRKLRSIHSKTRGGNLLSISNPLREFYLFCYPIIFLGFFIETLVKSNNNTTNAQFIRLKKTGTKDFVSLQCVFSIYVCFDSHCVSK